VTLSKDLVINGQSIGAAQLSSGFDHGIDGILGIGPVDLTANTLLPSSEEEIPTVTDQLFAQGKINRNMVSVFFQPSTLSNAGGEIIFGGIDRSKTTSSVMSVNVTQTQYVHSSH
jgi:cathepsin E